MRKNLSLAFIFLLISFLLAEIGFRVAGKAPFRMFNYSFNTTPLNCYIPDVYCGSKLGQGAFKVVINQGLIYTTTHVKTGNVVTRKIYDGAPDSSLPRIDFHGCSFTYGMGVSDTNVYPYLFARNRPDLVVRNYGCPGYSTLEALLILKQQKSENDLPKIVIVNYLDFHDERSAGSSQWREGQQVAFLKGTASHVSKEILETLDSCSFPFAQVVNNALEIRWYNIHRLYHQFWGRDKSALIYGLEKAVNKQKYDRQPEFEITKAILLEIQKLCNENKIELGVTTMSSSDKTHELINFLSVHHIKTIDLAIDFADPRYTNKPYDGHPSPLAHHLFADKLVSAKIGSQ